MELQGELNRLAGTTNLESAGAANVLAGTSKLELVGALNAYAGTTGLELNGVLKVIAAAHGGNPALDGNAALIGATTFSGPGDLSGLQLRLDASQLTAADGATVSTWPDVSGNGRNATAPGNSPVCKTNIVNGLRVVRFTQSPATPLVTANFMSGFTSGEGFIVVRIFPANTTTGGWWEGGTQSNSLHPFSDNNIYEGFGSTVRKSLGASPTTLNVFNVWNVSSASGAWTARINSTTVHTTSTNTVGFQNSLTVGSGGSSSGLCVQSGADIHRTRANVELP
jgi:hypothetical protein